MKTKPSPNHVEQVFMTLPPALHKHLFYRPSCSMAGLPMSWIPLTGPQSLMALDNNDILLLL